MCEVASKVKQYKDLSEIRYEYRKNLRLTRKEVRQMGKYQKRINDINLALSTRKE